MRLHSNPSITARAESDEEAEILRPLNNLHKIIREMFHEIESHHTTIQSLREWAQMIDPLAFAKMDPWPQSLISAWEEYKFFVQLINAKKLAFVNYRSAGDEDLADTSDWRFKRVHLAIEWGKVALSATEARLHVLCTYQNAFENTKAIDGHIEQANANLNSARDAVREAGINYRRYWANMAREPPCKKGIPYEDYDEESNPH
ncbi:polysaccharide lyase family protein [Aspergillus niger]|uniref:Contig An01c0070, genomic contig n=4 Tax=Aspergillus TaxID=5052 RepID=A2Q7R6_ASPNC|nr:uncharacterized protein BO96DRAFT_426649 [Aspergillus niger CBS 101883]XP_059603076.1 uncharacterized protein An01g01680 [Aspergillus niger]RDH19834.1 hypothetical protein M747DRAFT_306099 [Aspergillus niger ATCC 13496]PYH52295.1 hypothetical protein BO96DRAFT_426649 [Aspergillus niger CBS 101883]CAK43539.1 unnamed protein product [Aspergillus niger]GJP94525.1 polysaccharide lyase family protein [Aspergillus niger]